MNKIQEEFEKYTEGICNNGAAILDNGERITVTEILNRLNSANPLPTEKVCPECGGSGRSDIGMDYPYAGKYGCDKCETTGIIQIYYTCEEYLRIMGVPYPDDCLVWIRYESASDLAFMPLQYLSVKDSDDYDIYIVQTAQPAPEADCRREG